MLTRLTASADTWDLVWSWVGRVLKLNLGIAVTNLPLLAGLLAVEEPWRYPVFFGLLSLGLGPSLAAAFAALEGFGFVRSYRRYFGRALLRWSVVVAGLGILFADMAALHSAAPGALLVPMLAVLAAILLSSGLLALALLPVRPEVRLRFAVYTAVRRWPLSLLSLGVSAVAVVVVNQAPLAGLATVPGCALFVIWANSRASLSFAGRTP